MQFEFLTLRLIHVVGGVFWVGSALFTNFLLFPALGASPTTGQVIAALTKRKMFTIMPVVAILTMLSGLRLMWIISSGFAAEWMASGSGQTFLLGGFAAIAAFFLGMLVGRPAAVRAGQIAQTLGGGAMPNAADRTRLEGELATLRRRAGMSGVIVTVLLVVSAVAMAIARYM